MSHHFGCRLLALQKSVQRKMCVLAVDWVCTHHKEVSRVYPIYLYFQQVAGVEDRLSQKGEAFRVKKI